MRGRTGSGVTPAVVQARLAHTATRVPTTWQSENVRNLGRADQSGILSGAPAQPPVADALLGLLHPAWQALIAICLLVVTLLGIRRLAVRGPARVTNALFFTGFLIVAITVVGTLVVSCSNRDGQRSTTQLRSPSP
jgi:hypothetical protein